MDDWMTEIYGDDSGCRVIGVRSPEATVTGPKTQEGRAGNRVCHAARQAFASPGSMTSALVHTSPARCSLAGEELGLGSREFFVAEHAGIVQL